MRLLGWGVLGFGSGLVVLVPLALVGERQGVRVPEWGLLVLLLLGGLILGRLSKTSGG